ncbi:MAG: hypothetical protein QXL03_03610, partial [Acidilobaceae archaeon]
MVSKQNIVSFVIVLALIAVIGFTMYSVVTSGRYLDVVDLASINRPCTVTVTGVIISYESKPEEGVLYIKLTSKKDSSAIVNVRFNYNQFVVMHKQAPGDWMIGREIVVKGVFYPEVQIIDVRDIMVPCHEGYG